MTHKQDAIDYTRAAVDQLERDLASWKSILFIILEDRENPEWCSDQTKFELRLACEQYRNIFRALRNRRQYLETLTSEEL